MKRVFFISLIVVVVIIICLFRIKPITNESVIVTKPTPTNVVAALAMTNRGIVTTISIPQKPKQIFNATKAQSIADWTNAIPNLKILTHTAHQDSWIMEQRDEAKCPELILTENNGKSISFTSSYIDVDTVGDYIRRIELQTPNMNIDDVRAFGLQLCALLNIDSKSFQAWCDEVGNRWVDQPIFYSGAGASPDPNKVIAFNIRHTFNKEKPWYIDFIFQDK